MELDVLSTKTTRRRRTDDCLVVYLDTCINEVHLDQLSELGLLIKSFTDPNECTNFITLLEDKKVFCLVADQLVEDSIFFLNHSPLVTSIYVICINEEIHEFWTNDYTKVKGIYGNILPLIDALKQDVELVHRNSTLVTVLSPALSSQPLNTLDAMFMHYELLKETFLEMNHGEQAKQALVDLCKREYADNKIVLRIIHEFDQHYGNHPPTWWYTRDCFVYRMLNKALRTYDIDVTNKFGFFIKDLHRQLKDLRHTLPSEKFTLYRGQGMSIEEFNKLKKNEGGLLVFNSYLSTSGDKNISMKYAVSSLDNINMKAIFFVIHVDQTLSSNIVASLGENLSYFPHEQEYLWDMNSIFRIGKILEEENDVCQVNLTVTSDDDPQLRQLMEFMRRESGTLPGMQRLGNLMIEMGEWMKAKEIFETILQEAEDPCIIQQLGFIAHQMNNLDEALRYYQHSLSIFLTNQSPDDPRLATLYSNIGCILKDQGNLKEAGKQFQRALKLECSTNNPNKENIAKTRNNIATLLEKHGRRKEALKNMKSVLETLREHLPPTHPEIAASYNNIGTFYYEMGDYPNALLNYEKCRDIQQASLPSQHPDLTRTNLYMKRTMAIIQQRERTSTEPTLFARRVPYIGSRCNCFRFIICGSLCLVLVIIAVIVLLISSPTGRTTIQTSNTTNQSQVTTSFSKLKSNMWKPVGNMSSDRRQHIAIYIPMDDSVMIAGGFNSVNSSLKRMEKFFPSCDCFKEFGHGIYVDGIVTGAVLLYNGHIALTSGPPPSIILVDSIEGKVVSSSSSFTAVNNSFIPTFLPVSGEILLIDGTSVSGMNNTSQYQLYDPLTSKVRFAKGTIRSARVNYAISYIDTVKKVLVTGGQDTTVNLVKNFADLYDVGTNTVFPLYFSRMSVPRVWHTSTFIPTINRVLLCGGCTNLKTVTITSECELSTNTCELFDPTTDTFFALQQTMLMNRYKHSAVYLPELNMVLIAGGERTQTALYASNQPFLQTTELFDPVSYNFVMAAEMMMPRSLFTLTLVPPSDHALACGGNYFKTETSPISTVPWWFILPSSWWGTSTCEMFIP